MTAHTTSERNAAFAVFLFLFYFLFFCSLLVFGRLQTLIIKHCGQSPFISSSSSSLCHRFSERSPAPLYTELEVKVTLDTQSLSLLLSHSLFLSLSLSFKHTHTHIHTLIMCVVLCEQCVVATVCCRCMHSK